MSWDTRFLALFRRCVDVYRGGNRDFNSYYRPEDHAFLAGIGCQPRELFDFVEDLVDEDCPAEPTALLITAVRRDYFLAVQHGTPSERVVTSSDLPTFGDELEGLTYLPRILTKARAKLRGELDPDLMFCCGGDRKFLRDHGDIHPADFLRNVWAAGDDDPKVAAYVRSRIPA